MYVRDDPNNPGDVIDQANEAAALFLGDALAGAKRKAEAERLALGEPGWHCLFCDAELIELGRFCGTDCSADWQREQDAKRRNIKVSG